jgi:transketolase
LSVATDRGAPDTLCVDTVRTLAARFNRPGHEIVDHRTYAIVSDGDLEEVIFMASGSEVHVAHDAARAVEADGVRVRLVSMPCLDRFAAQDQAYRDRVLPPHVRARRVLHQLT